MKKNRKNDVVMLALTPEEVSGVPDLIKIIPKGYVTSSKGDFYVDEESFKLINEQFTGRRLDMVVDYEHQTLYGGQAPAAGWITELVNGEDAILAKVKWTSKAEEYLKNKEYRYLSPVILTRKTDKKVVAIHSVAVTNTPAIDGMFPLVGCSLDPDDYYEEETKMELEKLIKLLGLPENATEGDVEKAIQGIQESAAKKTGETEDPEVEVTANSTILSLLGLKEDANTAEVVAKIVTLQNGDAQLALKYQALENQMKERTAEEAVTAALKAGKITPAQKDWAQGYALKDPKGFASFVDKAPVSVVMENLTGKDPKEKKENSMDVNRAALKNLGISDEDLKKYYKEETNE